MITYSKLGHPRRGRLGNQLFQIASTIGLADNHRQNVTFPQWSYSKYFALQLPTGGRFDAEYVVEAHFHHDDLGLTREGNYDVDGWLQSLRYWEHCEGLIRDVFTFKQELVDNVRARFREALARPTIAISVRRGDFVGNPNYWQLPASYYYLALFTRFPDWRDYNILVFSDDLAYCNVHFEGLPNVYFAEGCTDIEQLCLMAQCYHFIVSNSTFSWWGAYLGEKPGTRVIRPNYLFDGELKRQHRDHDYWPGRWEVFDHAGKRLDLTDVTFTLPVFVDHTHRKQNVNLSVCMLQRDLNTNIIVGEQGTAVLGSLARSCSYLHFSETKVFHRTYMLNEMARMAETPFVVNWDCDVFVPPVQLWLAAERLRAGDDMVYPYDGRFARVPRHWFGTLEKALDLGVFRDTHFTGKHGKPLPTTSVGGAIMFNKESFFTGGGENERMVSFGPEDWERNFRFKALGYTVTRVDGSLYHLDHWCGPNSSNRNPFFKHNHAELDRLRAMTPEELDAYVCGWPWR